MHPIADSRARPRHAAGVARSSGAPTTAVILAAGNGSRMGGEVPKPLMRVLGMRLIERTILALANAGVTRFVVVVGSRADEIEHELRTLPRLRPLVIELVPCATWEHGNGHSLACGAAAAAAPFYLAMADHVFDPAIIRRLGDAAVAHPEDVHLATDGRVADVFDLDDATKVSGIDDKIVAIGKNLETYDRVDVGLFACPSSIAGTAAAVVASGGSSVSDVMREMISRGAMRSVSVEGLVWQDVDTPGMLAEAERRLLASGRKTTDGPVSRWLNRPVSLALTRHLARAHVTPNQITTVVFVLGIVTAVLIARGSRQELLIAALLVHVASVLDGCDGELARVAVRSSRFGAWYDTITDNLRYAAMVTCSGVALYHRDDSIGYGLGGAAFLACAIYVVVTMALYLRKTGAPGTHLVVVHEVDADAARTNVSLPLRLLYAARPLAKQDVLAAIAVVLLVAGWLELMVIFGLIAVASMIITVDRAIGDPRGAGPRFMMGVAGSALFVWLLARAPLGAIGDAIGRVGWPILLVVPIVLGWMLANSCSLHILLGGRVRLLTLLHNRIIGDGYNAIVPAAGVGGEPLRIALLERYVPAGDAAVAVITDRVLQLAAGLVVSTGALVVAMGALELPEELSVIIPIYSVVAVVGTASLLLLVQGDLSVRIVGRLARWLGGSVEPAHIPPRTILIALGWNILGRVLAALEVVLYVRLLGVELSVLEVVFITGMLHAVGAALFVVPQGIGVAEAASVYAFQALGYAPTVGLAFGLIRRARIIAFSAAAIGLHLLTRRVRTPRP
ncbi:MAG: hypothetical protein JWP01_4130 [Myxococcales bacterium]|nr:hypothetical protein [Myxococcales bacterium]